MERKTTLLLQFNCLLSKQKSIILMKHHILMVMVLLIVGCSNPTVITINRTINHTIYKNNTIYINDTVLCNTTYHEPEINISYDRLELIRRLKYYEDQQSIYFNDSECYDDLNRTETKLDVCEDELCGFNSSWC